MSVGPYVSVWTARAYLLPTLLDALRCVNVIINRTNRHAFSGSEAARVCSQKVGSKQLLEGSLVRLQSRLEDC